MDSNIDYSDYTLEELNQSAQSIDRERFPERAFVIDKLIREKSKNIPVSPVQTLIFKSDVKRIDRFLGALIDLCFSLVVSIPYLIYRGDELNAVPSTQVHIIFVWLGAFLYFAVQGYLLYKNSQTLGKYVMSTRIENLDGTRASLIKILFLRTIPMMVIVAIPFLGLLVAGILNPLLIFGENRRCLHDYIAQTRVCYVEK